MLAPILCIFIKKVEFEIISTKQSCLFFCYNEYFFSKISSHLYFFAKISTEVTFTYWFSSSFNLFKSVENILPL